MPQGIGPHILACTFCKDTWPIDCHHVIKKPLSTNYMPGPVVTMPQNESRLVASQSDLSLLTLGWSTLSFSSCVYVLLFFECRSGVAATTPNWKAWDIFQEFVLAGYEHKVPSSFGAMRVVQLHVLGRFPPTTESQWKEECLESATAATPAVLCQL